RARTPDDDAAAEAEAAGADALDARGGPPAEHLLQRVLAPEALDARPQEAAGRDPRAPARRAEEGQSGPCPQPPRRERRAAGDAELARGHQPARPDRLRHARNGRGRV